MRLVDVEAHALLGVGERLAAEFPAQVFLRAPRVARYKRGGIAYLLLNPFQQAVDVVRQVATERMPSRVARIAAFRNGRHSEVVRRAPIEPFPIKRPTDASSTTQQTTRRPV